MNKTGRGAKSTVGSGPSRSRASPLGDAPTSDPLSGEVIWRCLLRLSFISEQALPVAPEQRLMARAQSSHLWHSFRPVDPELRLSRHFLVSELALRRGRLVS